MTADTPIDIAELDDDDRLHIIRALELWCAETSKAAKNIGDKSGLRHKQGELDGIIGGIQHELVEPGLGELAIRQHHLGIVRQGLVLLHTQMQKVADKLVDVGEPSLARQLRGRADVVQGRLVPFFDEQQQFSFGDSQHDDSD